MYIISNSTSINSGYSDIKQRYKKNLTFIPAFNSDSRPLFDKPIYQSSYESEKRSYNSLNLAMKIVFPKKKHITSSDLSAYDGVVKDYLFEGEIVFLIKNVRNSLSKLLWIRKIKIVSLVFEKVSHYFNIACLLVSPFDSGSNRIGLLNRTRILEEKRIDFIKRCEGCASLTNLALDEERNFLDIEMIKMFAERDSIRRDYHMYLIGLVKYMVSNLALITSYSPFKILIDFAYIVGQIPCLIEFIDLILVSMNLKQTRNDCEVYENWMSNFLNKTQVVVRNDIPQIENPTFDLNKELSHFNNGKTTWSQIMTYFITQKTEIINPFEISNEVNKIKSLRDRKILQLLASPHNIDFVLKKYFAKKNNFSEIELNKWYQDKPKIFLLNEYINQQMDLELSTKQKLTDAIKSKLKLEKGFIDLNNSQLSWSFGYSCVALFSSVIGTVIGCLYGPIGMITGAVIGIYIASIILNLSFAITNYVRGSKYRSHSSGLLNLKIKFNQLKFEISRYWLNVEYNKLLAISPTFLTQIEKGEKVTELTTEAIQKFDNLCKKNYEQGLILEKLQTQRCENEIQDFEKYAHLPNDFFQKFIDDILLLNFNLSEKEVDDLFEIELGLDLDKLKKYQMSSSIEGENRTRDALIKDLQTFFSSNETKYGFFMNYQKKRFELNESENPTT